MSRTRVQSRPRVTPRIPRAAPQPQTSGSSRTGSDHHSSGQADRASLAFREATISLHEESTQICRTPLISVQRFTSLPSTRTTQIFRMFIKIQIHKLIHIFLQIIPATSPISIRPPREPPAPPRPQQGAGAVLRQPHPQPGSPPRPQPQSLREATTTMTTNTLSVRVLSAVITGMRTNHSASLMKTEMSSFQMKWRHQQQQNLL